MSVKYFIGLAVDVNDDEYIIAQGDGTCKDCEVIHRPMYCNRNKCLKNKLIFKRRLK